jgi:hypothetical protein
VDRPLGIQDPEPVPGRLHSFPSHGDRQEHHLEDRQQDRQPIRPKPAEEPPAAIFSAAVRSTDRSFAAARPTRHMRSYSEEEEVEILRELQTILGNAPPATSASDTDESSAVAAVLLPNGAATVASPPFGNDDICLERYAGRGRIGRGKSFDTGEFKCCVHICTTV